MERPEQSRLFHADNYPNWMQEQHQEPESPIEYTGQEDLFGPENFPDRALHYYLLVDNPPRNRRHIRIDSHDTPYGPGYLVSLDGSCRLLGAINASEEEGGAEWHAETFRMKFPTDEHERVVIEPGPWQDQIWDETSQNPVDLRGLMTLVNQLKFEYGMEPDRTGRSNECNAIPDVISGGASQVIHSLADEGEEYIENPLSVVGITLEEDMPDLLYDIARHMTETVEQVRVYGRGKIYVYRSRLHNYPLGINSPDMLDLALIFAPGQSMWYAADVAQTDEIDEESIVTLCNYDRQIVASDIPSLILETLGGKVAKDTTPDRDIQYDDDLFIRDEGNTGYGFLEESA